MLLRLPLLLCCLVLLSPLEKSTARAQTDDSAACQSGKGSTRLDACSRIIESGLLHGKPISDSKLAIVLVYRSLAHSGNARFDQAIADLSRAIELKPEYAAAYYYRGLSHDAKGRFDRSLADYDAAVRFDAGFTRALGKRAGAYAANGEYERAIADFSEVIRREPRNYLAFAGRGAAHFERVEYDLANKDFNKAIRLKPELATAYALRGNVRAELGYFDSAISDFDKALGFDPDDAAAYCGRGRVFVQKGDVTRALADFNASVRAEPVGNACLIDRGRAYQVTGQLDLAIEDFDEAALFFKSGSNAIEASAHLIAAYELAGQVPRAAAMLERAATDNPDLAAMVWHVKAKNKAEAGNLDGALADWRRAAEIRTGNAGFRLNAGIVLQRAGRRTRARKEWQAACSMASARIIRKWHYALAREEHYTDRVEDSCGPAFFTALKSCAKARCVM